MSHEMQHDLVPSSSTPEGITGQQGAFPVSAMHMGNATPPPPYREAIYQCDFPDCRRAFVQKELCEYHMETHNGPQLQPLDSLGWSNSNKKQKTTSRMPSYTFEIDEIEELDDHSARIASDIISSSAYRFPREKLKYTISEDRTIDARQRNKGCFLALKPPTRHTTKAKRCLG